MSYLTYKTDIEGEAKIENLLWIVENFIDVLNDKSTSELSPEEAVDTNKEPIESGFKVKMKLFGQDNDVIEIYYLSSSPMIVKVKLILQHSSSWSNVQPNETTLVVNEYPKVQVNKWQYLKTLLKCDMKNESRTLVNTQGKLNLHLNFQFIVMNDLKVDIPNIPTTQLNQDLEILFKNGCFSDVIMKSIDGNEYKAHKAILSSRSVVMKAHFEHNTIECITHVVKSLFEAEVLEDILTFIYSGKALKVNEIPERLLAAAEYYQLSDLKYLCETVLHKKLTIENAIETLQLAELHSATILKQITLQFIKNGQQWLIIKTDGWKKIQSVVLIKEICESIMALDK